MQQAVSDYSRYVEKLAGRAREAVSVIASATTAQKNEALRTMAELLDQHRKKVLDANGKDIISAKKNNLAAPLVDRLTLDDKRIDAMIECAQQIASLKDPVGEIDAIRAMPSGIRVGKMRVPLGVIGIIYESRPNVTLDAAALCLKSGNVCILRGGSEAFHSNMAIAELIQQGLQKTNLPPTIVNLIESTDREITRLLISSTQFLDLLIPRGGRGLIEHISEHSKVNVIKHLDGNCHIYIDEAADLAMGLKVALNAKTRRYGVCNAMESLLVHKDRAEEFLPAFADNIGPHKVELRGCPKTCALIEAKPANEEDWYEEYLAPILSIKVIDGLEEAIHHINHYGSHHTDAIITDSHKHGELFLQLVDSSSVMWNASTAFADGFEYGLGAEVGISTDKFHARGPVGLEGLTNQKFIILGEGNIRP